MAAIFQKRLRCFYCGQRSTQSEAGPIRKWQCTYCEAVNFLDEKGEITDPPTIETDPEGHGISASKAPFESTDFVDSGLFCRGCVRNQHLFMKTLATYFPDPDDPRYPAYEREYPHFRQNLEERYPQVCENCESRVKAGIHQAGYVAKADHLRRMMERSRTGRAARKARNRNWRSLLVSAGAVGYWGSVAGQLSWNLMGAMKSKGAVSDQWEPASSSLLSCIRQAIETQRVETQCSSDLVPYAGLALALSIITLWWNPKLRLKVEGRNGRFVGLGEYYKLQLILIVMRFVAWALLKDPDAANMPSSLLPVLHACVAAFTIMGVVGSRYIIRYDTRPLVLWSDSPQISPVKNTKSFRERSAGMTNLNDQQHPPGFPLEKLASPRLPVTREPSILLTPPPESDSMDWTPSLRQEIRPTYNRTSENSPKGVNSEPSPFYGWLPPVSKPLAWQLRNSASQKPIEQVVGPNPFRRAETPSKKQRGHSVETEIENSPTPIFASPRFFPPADLGASTELESLFDRAFTIKSPGDPSSESIVSTPSSRNLPAPASPQGRTSPFQYLRFTLLMISAIAWHLSRSHRISIPRNYVEIASLSCASLIAGFALLETFKRPAGSWSGLEISVPVAQLGLAIALGASLPNPSKFFWGNYFDMTGNLLLITMAVQEAPGFFFR
ncbi:Ima1 N-terminal domain containing protein [Elaphomyces granulatus]